MVPATRETIPFFVYQLVPTPMTERVYGRARARRQPPSREAGPLLSARSWRSQTNLCRWKHRRRRQTRRGCAPQRSRWWVAMVLLGFVGEVELVCQKMRALGPARETAEAASRLSWVTVCSIIRQNRDHSPCRTRACDDTIHPCHTPVPPAQGFTTHSACAVSTRRRGGDDKRTSKADHQPPRATSSPNSAHQSFSPGANRERIVMRHSTVPRDTEKLNISIKKSCGTNVRCTHPFTSAHGSHCMVGVRRTLKSRMWGRKPWGHGLHAPAIRRVFDEL